MVSALILGKYGIESGSYWKPVQTGTLGDADVQKIKLLTGIGRDRIRDPLYSFPKPASPHFAARSEGRKIDPEYLIQELSFCRQEKILIEGAGGIFVPLTETILTIDVIARSALEVMVIAHSNLGTINHSLLTLAALKNRNIPVIGFFVYGELNELLANNIETIRNFSGEEFLGYAFVPENIHRKEEFISFAKNSFDQDEKLKRSVFR